MYSIQVSNHQKYGTVVEIVRSEDGTLETPFVAIQRAFTERRLLMQGINQKIRFLIDGQVLTKSKVESWANEEYKSLPKCFGCAVILKNDVYNHTLSGQLFCSQKCTDRDYQELMERLDDEEECDCF